MTRMDFISKRLVPVRGAWVKNPHTQRTGVVIGCDRADGKIRLCVRWHRPVENSWVPLEGLACGFLKGMDVVDVPFSRVRDSLGEGVTVDIRKIGHNEQVLVEFPESGRRHWLPYENLRHVKGVRHRFLTADTGTFEDVERLRLRNLAYALEMWNENTGSLSHLDIDPLPHQIHLVHHILASGNLNWLIADDVGLGKTIEVGMLLSALKQRKMLRRVLLVTPAGLTKQWQEELHHKFGMGQFLIYGEDFYINEPHQWKLYDFVIGSVDRLKDDDHLERLFQSDPWDLVIFDEAHRLSRRQYGMSFESSQRYRLAATLRKKTDNILLLSATPHQGMPDKFQALLELLRPEWKKEIRKLDSNPDVLRHMVVRNNKADVTDSDGNFIFKGKITKAVKVNVGAEAVEFDNALQNYLKRGYAAGASRGLKGQAIGFVMTTYRKLAASSSAAILASLERRLERLRSEVTPVIAVASSEEAEENDDRFEGEMHELAGSFDPIFFEGEISLLEDLIVKAKALVEKDQKLQCLLDEIIPAIHAKNPNEKVLIFSEYRSTQDHLAKSLKEKYGSRSVELINGSMTHHDRKAAISRFEHDALFLLSTEAGGEGINLQKKCHVMVNYDLPWNPMRLVQRIGRLYRYGQKNKVCVFNIHAPNTMDEEILGLMYDRISAVVRDMAQVGEEFREGLEEDILGEMTEIIDIRDVLEGLPENGVTRTKDKIDEALRRAREATKKQRELFEYAASFDPSETKNELQIGSGHLEAFVRGMFQYLGIEIISETHRGTVLHVKIPDSVREVSPALKQRMAVTFDRIMASSRPDIHMLDLDSPLMHVLLQKAKEHDFGGQSAACGGLDGKILLTGILRWQDDQGKRMRQEYAAFLMEEDRTISINPLSFSKWLKGKSRYHKLNIDRGPLKEMFQSVEDAADLRFAEVSNRDLHPEGRQWVSCLWLPGV